MNPAKIDGTKEAPEEAEMEVSPFVELLVARMKSHPKEFYNWTTQSHHMSPNPLRGQNGLSQLIETTKSMWNRKEKRLYNEALREVRLQEAYERLVTQILK